MEGAAEEVVSWLTLVAELHGEMDADSSGGWWQEKPCTSRACSAFL